MTVTHPGSDRAPGSQEGFHPPCPSRTGSMSWFWHAIVGLHVLGVGLVVAGLRSAGVLHWSSPAPSAQASPSPGVDRSALGNRAVGDRGPAALGASELALLEEDQRVLYEIVATRDAELLQKDLPELTGFSKTKVSRLLDQLERKNLVQRLSHGMTNRVVLAPGPRR